MVDKREMELDKGCFRGIVQAKLQAIARHAQHALLADKIAWHQLALVDDVVAIVAATAAAAVPATGVTGGGQPGMGGIQAVYLSLLIQHMVDAPEAVTAFPALCVALGSLSYLISPPHRFP